MIATRSDEARRRRGARALLFAALALAGLFGAAARCSAYGELAGNGACDGYCRKAKGLPCGATITLDRCVSACLEAQARCPRTMSELMRCAANEGSVLCDGATAAPHVVNCAPAVVDRDTCLSLAYADAGPPEAGSLPSGL